MEDRVRDRFDCYFGEGLLGLVNADRKLAILEAQEAAAAQNVLLV